jgi:hypothetical protein
VVEGSLALASLDVTIGTEPILKLALMGVAMLVTTRAFPLLVFELDLRLVATGASQFHMLSKSWEPELRVVDQGTLERDARLVAILTIGGGLDQWMGWDVTGSTRRRQEAAGSSLGVSQVTSRASRACMFAHEREAEFAVIDLRPLEPRVLVVTIETILRPVTDRVVRHVTIDARAWHQAFAHLGVLMTINAGLSGMLSIQRQLGVLGMLRVPSSEQLTTQ